MAKTQFLCKFEIFECLDFNKKILPTSRSSNRPSLCSALFLSSDKLITTMFINTGEACTERGLSLIDLLYERFITDNFLLERFFIDRFALGKIYLK